MICIIFIPSPIAPERLPQKKRLNSSTLQVENRALGVRTVEMRQTPDRRQRKRSTTDDAIVFGRDELIQLRGPPRRRGKRPPGSTPDLVVVRDVHPRRRLPVAAVVHEAESPNLLNHYSKFEYVA